LACIYVKGERALKYENPLARSQQTHRKDTVEERERDEGDLVQREREMLHDRISIAPGFVMQFIFIQSLTRQVLFGRRREQKL
jgi:hypothetical protein